MTVEHHPGLVRLVSTVTGVRPRVTWGDVIARHLPRPGR